MDFTKTCWYCGNNDMKPYDGFYACENCGATWNEVPKLSVEEVVVEPRGNGTTKYRPSKRRIKGIGKKVKRKVKDAVNI